MKANNQLSIQSIHGSSVLGIQINQFSGCTHYHSKLDIVAIKFKCCSSYYSCYWCHQETQHTVQRWRPEEFNEPAILCGHCGSQLSIQNYLDCNSQCPYCAAQFNPGCKNHWSYYFEVPV